LGLTFGAGTAVRALLPGSAGCAILVTSRVRLSALAGSHGVALGALPADQAAGLLAAIVGAVRAAAEPEAVATIGGLCGYLPLALRIAGGAAGVAAGLDDCLVRRAAGG
jgi:hypothetical protein